MTGSSSRHSSKPASAASHLDFEGIRLTDLASRAGVTKQAVGQLIDELVELGVVERVADPNDRRAKRIRFSRRGYEGLMHGLGVLAGIQEALGAAVGRRRMRELHRTLKLLIAALEGSPLLAAPPATPKRPVTAGPQPTKNT